MPLAHTVRRCLPTIRHNAGVSPAASRFGPVHPRDFTRRSILLLAVIEGAVGFGLLAMWDSHLHHALDLSLSVSGAIVALLA
jgi:hypothetical protein